MKQEIRSSAIRLYDSGKDCIDRYSLVLLYPYRKQIKETGLRGIGIGCSEGTDQVIVCDHFEIKDGQVIGSDDMFLGRKLKLNHDNKLVPRNIRIWLDSVASAWLKACKTENEDDWKAFRETCGM